MIHWLIGPSGSGKSTVGSLLAERREALFIDLDKKIETTAGCSVADIFARHGEEEFRRLENQTLRDVIRSRRKQRLVVATGGGAVIDPDNRDLMRSAGVRILLQVDAETATERLRGSEKRPLLAGNGSGEDPVPAWSRMLEERKAAYADHDLVVDATGSVAHIADRIVHALQKFHSSVWNIEARLDNEKSRVYALRSPYSTIRAIRHITRFSRRFVLTDSNLAGHYAHTLRRIAGSDGVVFVVEPGEEHKSFESTEQIIERLQDAGFTRGDCVIGFGGGVVTDLAGFVASIYMRGIRCLTVPTSLLAMVDASVGGKTAINAAGVRNLVGTFRQPSHVLICEGFLRTLPERELRSGMVESLKMGTTLDKSLFALVRKATPRTRAGEMAQEIPEIIRLSIATKLRCVERDVQDTSSRGILNFGHTFGHALEAAMPGVFTHGEAVAFGMVAAFEAAMHQEFSMRIEAEQGEPVIEAVLPYTLVHESTPDFASVLGKMSGDKKRSGRTLRFVLPAFVGSNFSWGIRSIVEDPLILAAMRRAWERIVHYHRDTAQ